MKAFFRSTLGGIISFATFSVITGYGILCIMISFWRYMGIPLEINYISYFVRGLLFILCGYLVFKFGFSQSI